MTGTRKVPIVDDFNDNNIINVQPTGRKKPLPARKAVIVLLQQRIIIGRKLLAIVTVAPLQPKFELEANNPIREKDTFISRGRYVISRIYYIVI